MTQTFTPLESQRSAGAPARAARPLFTTPDSGRIAGLTLGRRLPAHRLGRRWLAGASPAEMTSVIYLLRAAHPEMDSGALAERLRVAAVAPNPHALPITHIEPASAGRVWIVTPYTGGADGLLTLGRLVATKDEGRMEPDEARRAIAHMLIALDAAHMRAIAHGPVTLDEVLVDRRGRALIELMGVDATLSGHTTPDVEAEVRSVIRAAMELLTGIQPASDEHWRRAFGLSRAWKRWLAQGLDPRRGFRSAAAALAALPSAWR